MRVIASVVVVCLLSAAVAQRTPAQGIRWVSSWDEALRLSKETARPIMVHFNMDGESACRNMAVSHFRNDKIIKLSRKFVCVVGSRGKHADEKIVSVPHGKCGRFGGVSCAEHLRCEYYARMALLDTKTVVAPQFVFATPDEKVILRKEWDMAPSALLKLMKQALELWEAGDVGREATSQRARRLEVLYADAASNNAARRRPAISALAREEDPAVIEFLTGRLVRTVDETHRLEVIRALGRAGNERFGEPLCGLLKDRSARIRRAAVVALYHVGSPTTAGALARRYGSESRSELKALLVRAAATCDPANKTVRKLVRKALSSSKSEVRAAAAWSLAGLEPTGSELKKLTALARSDQDAEVRAVACHALTTAAKLVRESRSDERPAAIVKAAGTPVDKALGKVARGDRDRDLRAFAAGCLEALADADAVVDEGIEDLYADADAFEREEESDMSKKGRRR